MSTYKDKSPRERYVVTIYLCITLPFAIAAMVGAAVGYAAVFSLKSDTPLSWLHLLGLTAVMVIALVIGFVIGGWAWAILGKLFFGIRRSAIEQLFSNGPQIRMVSRYNDWCLNLIFGPREKEDIRK
jgi:hypothetical protein